MASGVHQLEAAMIFLTEILGAEVIDVGQRPVGRVRDLTVHVREPYPVVTALVVNRRNELVIPWSEVRSYAGREVVLRWHRDDVTLKPSGPEDVWLARDVLDRQVVDTDGRRVVRVNDLQLIESGGSMLLVGADIGLRGILRRLGLEALGKALLRRFGRQLPMVLVSWDVVDPIASSPGTAASDAVRLRVSSSKIARLHPADIADIVEDLGSKERRALFEELSEDIAADTLEEMEHEDQVSVIEHMDLERASEILDEMAPDEAADILGDLPEEQADAILARMETEEAADVAELLAFPEGTAGRLMTVDYVAVSDTLDAEACIAELRRLEPDAESIYYVYVVDEDGSLEGVLSLRDLICAQPSTSVRDIATRDVVTVEVDADVKEIAAVLAKYNLLAVPVVDEQHRLKGIVTVDDAMEEVLPESIKRKLPKVV
jgi:CBS domain-containing protein